VTETNYIWRSKTAKRYEFTEKENMPPKADLTNSDQLKSPNGQNETKRGIIGKPNLVK
jgi:hypothetical protein